MKLNTKQKIGNIILTILGGIVLTSFLFSIVIVFSKELQSLININLTQMWVFGAMFGFFYEPFLKHILSPIVKKILSNNVYEVDTT